MKRFIKTFSAFISLIMMIPLVGCVGEADETTAQSEISTTPPSETEVQVMETTAEETFVTVQPSEWDIIREKANGEGIKILFIGDSLTH